MASRLRLAVVVGAALILGGPTGASASVDEPVEASPAAEPLQAPARATGPGPVRSELDSGPALQSTARRHRVKRRRPRFADVRLTSLRGVRSLRAVRSPTVDRIRGGRARARALGSDHAARGLTPAARTARLGRCSTWCTSVPPPGVTPHHFA